MSVEDPYAPPSGDSGVVVPVPARFSLGRVLKIVGYVLLAPGLLGLLCGIYFTGGMLTSVGLLFWGAGMRLGRERTDGGTTKDAKATKGGEKMGQR